MRYFLEKAEKSWQRWGSASKPRQPPAAGDSAPRPASCYFHSIYALIFSTAQYFSIPLKSKLRPTHTWVTCSLWAS